MVRPTFIIAGERRCGTTSLYRWLQRHPEIFLHPHRDMGYFIEDELLGGRAWIDGEADAAAWEATHSAAEYGQRFAAAEGYRAVGEKSADLLFWRPAHPRIARLVPEVKLIITLRNPVDRAWSHYWNEVGKGREPLSFEEALDAEEERAKGSAWARNHLSYLQRGFYEQSLTALYTHIAPERVLVQTLEHNRQAPQESLRQIYRFLGVSPDQGLERAGSHHNRNTTLTPRPWATLPLLGGLARFYDRLTEALLVRTIPPQRREAVRRRLRAVSHRPARRLEIPAPLYQRLTARYRPHVQALADLLDRPLPEWN